MKVRPGLCGVYIVKCNFLASAGLLNTLAQLLHPLIREATAPRTFDPSLSLGHRETQGAPDTHVVSLTPRDVMLGRGTYPEVLYSIGQKNLL